MEVAGFSEKMVTDKNAVSEIMQDSDVWEYGS